MTSSPLAPILRHLRRAPSRSWSIVITIYGDAIVPRGGSVALGSLLALFRALEFQDGVLRTAMSRLAASGLLCRSRVGRNSFYRLAEEGRATFATAAAHIYAAEPPPWDGLLRLILSPNSADKAPDDGFLGTAAPGLFVSPFPILPPATMPGAVLLDARAEPAAARSLARRAWQLDEIASSYEKFLAAFAPLRRDEDLEALAGIEAMALRILLIHDYRRVVLRDPRLPAALLAEDWPGRAARALCAAIYHAVLPASERWLDDNALSETGRLPPPDDALHRRFAGRAMATPPASASNAARRSAPARPISAADSPSGLC